MAAKLSAVLLVALGLLAVAHAADRANTFNDFMVGEWDVRRSTASLETSEQTFDELKGRYSIQKENGTMNLIGRYYDNDTATGEITNEMDIEIDFSSPNSGSFKTGPSDLETKTLFNFDFVTQENGMMLSHGVWAEGKAHYQFNVAGFDRFTITVFPIDGKKEVTVYVGKRIIPPVEKTFFQQYGTMIMLGGIIFFNMFIQKKAKGMQQQVQGQADPAAAAGAPRAPRAISGGGGKKSN